MTHPTIGIRQPTPPVPGSTTYQHQVSGVETIEYLAWRYYGDSKYWWAFARASPCVVVEAEGEWGGTHAFCGAPHWLNDTAYTIHDLREITPGVPESVIDIVDLK